LQLDFAARELTLKLVYYGPALSGKTTNLRALHELAAQESRGRLMTLDTKDDRTLFFDLLPLHLTAAFVNLRQNLSENGIKPSDFPVVIQFNKRDLPEIRPDAEIDQLAVKGKEPVFKAVATRGEGVVETFLGLMQTTWNKLEQHHHLEQKFQIEAGEVVDSFRRQLGHPAAQAGGAR
jgi:hypothetical protein